MEKEVCLSLKIYFSIYMSDLSIIPLAVQEELSFRRKAVFLRKALL